MPGAAMRVMAVITPSRRARSFSGGVGGNSKAKRA